VIETKRKRELSQIFSALADELDVPVSKYEDAAQRYQAVGAWLSQDDSELATYSPEVYPQGSFALGTAVRPLGKDDYDVDAVCLLDLTEAQVSQQQLKNMVGDRLKANRTYAGMLDPKDGGRRTWKLRYADESKFHLDILPAIPDSSPERISIEVPVSLSQHAICITDKITWSSGRWPKSNPKGYAEWFKERMRVAFEERRRHLAIKKQAEIQQIPEHEVRTPLQRVIQLLKRHRDLRYNGDDDKPISIIVTTLAAQAYNNESDLVDALLNIVPGMRLAIEHRNGVIWVPNPVNPEENFADRWAETPRKADLFFEWLHAVEREHRELLAQRGVEQAEKYLAESYGPHETIVAMAAVDGRRESLDTQHAITTSALNPVPTVNIPSFRFDVPHRELPQWPVALNYEAKLTARASRQGWRTLNFHSNPKPLLKHFSLRFEVSTNVPWPFNVYWQVVNTGEEAANANGLRGAIFEGTSTRFESTLYQGKHWVECFIVKNEQLVARSGEFIVNIA
jgi:hypothetical protein